MMRKYLYAVLFLQLAISFSTKAQFTIDGQFRTRAEMRDGYRALASEATHPAVLVSQRSRLIFSYSDSNFLFKFSGQDARVWGQNWNAMASNTLHLYEAWAGYKVNPNLLLKVGRQELLYDDQRLMATRNFSITGVTYDAALLIYSNKDKGLNLHFGTMVNNVGEVNFLDGYNFPLSFKYMSFLWMDKKLNDMVSMNAINFFDLSQNPADNHIMYGRNTLGANVILKFSDTFGGRVGGYYQFGNHWLDLGTYGASHKKISAYSYNLSMWVKPAENLKISAHVDTYSGHDWSGEFDTFTAFNRLLAGGHAHLGFIDYFTSADLREVRWAGIHDLFLQGEYVFSTKLNLQATLHYFMLNKPHLRIPGPDTYTTVSKGLGTEVDFVLNYRVNQALSLQASFSSIFPTESLETLKLTGALDSEFSYYAYLSLLFTPKFLKWENK